MGVSEELLVSVHSKKALRQQSGFISPGFVHAGTRGSWAHCNPGRKKRRKQPGTEENPTFSRKPSQVKEMLWEVDFLWRCVSLLQGNSCKRRQKSLGMKAGFLGRHGLRLYGISPLACSSVPETLITV